ncbi:hypothetical protein [Nocardia sp. NPDC050406]|uniref:hypothetical protein n=1 Tax=Nocardia sp. NPDC050406 TaxID=3364318 RepID=UPI00378C955B
MNRKILQGIGSLLTYAGVVGVIVGGAIFLIALFSNPDGDPKCDGTVMKPGDICESGAEGVVLGRTYDEVRAENAEKKDGLYLGPSVLIASIGLAVVGSRIDENQTATV